MPRKAVARAEISYLADDERHIDHRRRISDVLPGGVVTHRKSQVRFQSLSQDRDQFRLLKLKVIGHVKAN